MRRPASFENLEIPNVDISEDNENYYIISELPGIKDNEVRVTVGDDLLTISGYKNRISNPQERKQYRNEITYRDFVRSFSLPRNVKAEAISGTFRDGLLELTLPKVTQTMPPARDLPLGNASVNSGANTTVVSITPTRQEKTEAKAILA